MFFFWLDDKSLHHPFELSQAPDDMKRVTSSLFILPHPRKTWIYTNGVKNNMPKIVVKIQLLTMEMVNHLSQQFLYFLHSPFVPTNTPVAERLQSHRNLDCMFSKENGI